MHRNSNVDGEAYALKGHGRCGSPMARREFDAAILPDRFGAPLVLARRSPGTGPREPAGRRCPANVTGGSAGRNGLGGAPCRLFHGPGARLLCCSRASCSDACSSGRSSGPGSWPPANLTSASIRLSIGGCVANRSAKPSRGLSMHISITAEVAPVKLAAAFDLAQRHDHGVGVLGQLHRAGIGEIFALSRQREADHDRQQPGHRDQRDGDEDRDAAAALAAVAVAGARTAPPPQRTPPWNIMRNISSAKKPITPAMISGDHQHAHVAVADMGQLVAEHRLHLRVVEAARAGRWSP